MTCFQDFFHMFCSNNIHWFTKEKETKNENFYFKFKQYKTKKMKIIILNYRTILKEINALKHCKALENFFELK